MFPHVLWNFQSAPLSDQPPLSFLPNHSVSLLSASSGSVESEQIKPRGKVRCVTGVVKAGVFGSHVMVVVRVSVGFGLGKKKDF